MGTLSRTTILTVAVLFGVMAFVAPMSAAAIQEPAVITSAGQSPGGLMVQVLANRTGVENVYDELIEAEALEGAGSLILVIGASMKGLGAAGIDLEDEYARVTALLDRATEMNIPVVAMHIEGAPRRGVTSDELAAMVFPYAAYAVVRNDADTDGFFTNLATEHGVELIKVEAAAHFAGVLQDLYN